MNRTKLGKKNRSSRSRKRARFLAESLESRILLAGDTMAFHNAGLPLDTNDDGQRTALDALLIINDLNEHGSRDVVAGMSSAGLVDTNGDGVVSPADVVGIVNFLNRPSGESDAKVQVRLAVTPLDSLDPITSIGPNEEFLLRAFVTDITEAPEGVFGGFLDVNYTAELADVSGDVIHSDIFPNGPNSVTDVDGLLDEVGSFSNSFTGGGDTEQLLWSVPLTTEAVGTISFMGNPPDILPNNEFTLFGQNEGVLGEEIMFINTTLDVIDENAPVIPTANDDAFQLLEDSTLTVGPLAGVLNNDLPDGVALTASLVSNVQNGVLELNADGSFVYTPTTNFNGEDSFTYTASDGTTTSAVPALVTLTVSPVNDAPIAVNDSFTTPAGVTLIQTEPDVGLLANDTDVEGEVLELLTDEFVGPDNGILTASAQGGIAYIPDPGFIGVDTFTYIISDASGAISNRATVTINVVGSNNPVAVADSFSTTANTVLTVPAIGVLANDTDPNGDMLVAQLLTQPENGTVILGPSGALQYTPDLDFVGVDTFTYQASDGPLFSEPTTVTITVDDPFSTPPVARDDEFATLEDVVLTVDAPGVLENDTDFDGSPLTVSLLTQTSNGTVVLAPDGSFVYTPTLNFDGPTDSFTYEVSDGVRTDTATVTINVAPTTDAPITAPDNYIVQFETTLEVSAADGVLANDIDVDSPVITSLLLIEPANGVAVLQSDGSFTYTPDDGFVGIDSFTYGAQDGFLTQFETVTLDVQPPDLTSDLVSFRVAVTDSAGVELTELMTGDAFELRVFVDDISSAPQGGVFAAYADVLWASSLAVVTGAIDHGEIYVNGTSGVATTPGLLDEVGGFDGLEPLGGAEQLVFSVPMLATGAGELTFTTDPADDLPFGDVLLFETLEDAIPADLIFYGSTSVTVLGLPQPVAVADFYETSTNSITVSAAEGVLSNDLPADGGGSLIASLVQGPANGTLSLNANGSFTYVADAGFVGTDTFTYSASGVASSSVPATVSILVDDPDPNSVSGVVFFDSNNNGVREAAEHSFGGVNITLTGTTVFGDSVLLTTTTSASGAYSFGDLVAGSYVVTQEQPAITIDGTDTVNGEVASNDSIALELSGGVNATANFGERGLQPQFIGNSMFMSTRPVGGAGIGLNGDGTTSWYCLDSGFDGVESLTASVSADGSAVTVTALQNGTLIAGTVPVDSRNVVVLGNAQSGFFVRLNGPISALNLQAVANGEATDAVFAE